MKFGALLLQNLKKGGKGLSELLKLESIQAFENQKSNYSRVLKLRDYLFDKLSTIKGISFNSSKECSPYIVSFSVNKKASVVQEALSEKEIYVSTKSACSSKKDPSSYVLEAMNKNDWVSHNSLRISFTYKNTIEEIDIFVRELENILNTLK